MKEFKTIGYVSGTQTKIPSENIAQDAASDALNWITFDGHLELARGRQAIGAMGALGGIFGEIFAPKVDGTKVHFRKTKNKIQYFDGSAWQDIITGLTDDSSYTFALYNSLAGAYVLAGGPDGFYKIATANPGSFKNMYVDGTNHKGYIIINEQRTFLWSRFDGTPDKTALYLSKIDPQGTNYTTVTNEVIATGDGVTTHFTGTLAAATGKRFVFGVNINMNPTGIVGTDNFVGVITGAGITGTINYATGAYVLDFTVPPALATQVRASYQWEDSNNGGITDFRFTSPTRLAGEGDIIPQEFLGEPIQNVLVFEGKYYSMKKTSVYELDLTIDDTNATNLVYRADIGIPSLRAAVSTGKGIVYMDTANPSKPILSLLQRNPVGGNLEPINLTPLFKWEDYVIDDECMVDTWGENIIVSAKTATGEVNDRLFLINVVQKYSVDITYYGARTSAKNDGLLYIGDPFTDTVFEIFSGFDDLAEIIENFWAGKDETYGSETLKRYRYIRLKGLIDPSQWYEVFGSFDDGDYTLLGTIRGDASYVDFTNPQSIGTNTLGTENIGGGEVAVAYPYLAQIRVRVPKFRTRKFKFVAGGIGFASIDWETDVDILSFEQKIPKRFRQKAHVSLDGTQTDLPTFDS